MSCQYYCDACGKAMGISDKFSIHYLVPWGENLSKYEFCRECMKKVSRFIKSLKDKK